MVQYECNAVPDVSDSFSVMFVMFCVLMSESCILGPEPHAHVRCRSWSGDLVLFRRGEEIMCRTQAAVEIDGETCTTQARLRPSCRIEGEEFAMSLEEV